MRPLAALLGLALAACGGGVEAVVSCEDEGGVHPVCGFRNLLRSGELFMGSFTGDRIVRTALP